MMWNGGDIPGHVVDAREKLPARRTDPGDVVLYSVLGTDLTSLLQSGRG